MSRLVHLLPANVRRAGRRVRDVLRRWERAPVDAPLPAADCRGVVEPVTPTYLLERGQSAACPVRVRNLGSVTWSSHGKHPVRLALHWLTAKKEPAGEPTLVPLPQPVHPGQAVTVPARLVAPAAVGHYLVEAEVVQDGGPAFRDHGCRPALIEAQVTGRDADDIDYFKAYATADLTRDFWTVVGPRTKDEFDRLGQAKLKHLLDVGLRPDSRVLDVGCGTGQLAVALEGFLSDAGRFVGTDIGPEAVAFCREHYKRPNFRFLVNGMTDVPITGEAFDYVTFFSVFTHTFPDETALLLAEAARLLAPGGSIVADVFVSPLVERCAGNRGMMELNRDHFLRLVKLVGLTMEVMADWEWSGQTRRQLLRLTRPATGAAG
ncbi:MAG: methyltransferase domain-containing protein [Gemmataceae bacterium]